jgi:predicted nucleic acid-binding protein
MGTVLIPPAVKAELTHANTPAIVRASISQPPQWLEVVSLKQPVDSALAHLDPGEREAISLASELQAILLLMDERDGVAIARHRGLKVVGALAALGLAAAHGLVDLQTMVERLRATTVTGSPHGEHAGAGCRTQETSRRSMLTGWCSAFGALANEIDGVAVKQLISAGVIKKNGHQVSDFGTTAFC